MIVPTHDMIVPTHDMIAPAHDMIDNLTSLSTVRRIQVSITRAAEWPEVNDTLRIRFR